MRVTVDLDAWRALPAAQAPPWPDIEALEETKLVRSWGGRALTLPFVDGYSSTELLRRARACS